MISIIGAGAADSPERGEQVFDTMVCVTAHSGAPDRVVNQISQAQGQGVCSSPYGKGWWRSGSTIRTPE